MASYNSLDFYFDLFERGKFPPVVDDVYYSCDNSEMIRPNNSHSLTNSDVNGWFYLNNVPDYLNLTLKPDYKSKTFQIAQGFIADLTGYSDISNYLRNNLRPRLRTAVKSNIRRLELCFNITYHVYYGEISQEQYDSLMNNLYKFILRRFDELKEENERINEWERFYNLFLPLIRDKKASLFVIYDDGVPINISLNYHYDKVLFYAIPGFDIDYSKFGLGHIMLYKQIEWCIENNYKHFDMSMGDLDYKRQWCTNEYYLERHLIFQPKSIPQAIGVLKEEYIAKLKVYLQSKNIHLVYHSLIKLFNGTQEISEKEINTELRATKAYTTLLEIVDLENYAQYKIDFKNKKYSFLLRQLYDYLFTQQLPIDSITVYEIKPHEDYIIQTPQLCSRLYYQATEASRQ
ncbi:GNAT family N-acetyltransferase [Arenibacter sp. BSSL-BM3]|uniref:GNAT family N-acetyltransferase n=1 Tax=Arenibacter arenosicollis TaxID=2762274 RepID=A0ABR7QKZ6_9FLAO|nr:GNAT family N-acetyltransferase [Arenibacter arenosicollis]MBC8767851.1 GNAT family N-acetyltransferase [Arenibacter arenosicollis]